MPAPSTLTPILDHLRAEPSRTWSLIITLYGDVIVPRGGRVWLGTLLEILAALEIGGNVVRTAMSRLASDGWLERSRIGRNSYYRLAEKGRAEFADAAARIYGGQPPAWDGIFHIAVQGERAALEGSGYALLAPGVYVAATPPAGALREAAIGLRATTDGDSARRLAAQVWPTHEVAEGYRRFLEAFSPLRDLLATGRALTDLEALVARLLLVHEYRRLVLRDPLLPAPLRPADWPGEAARDLCGALYPILLPGSERWLNEHAVDEGGPLPAPEIALSDRFTASYYKTR